MAGGDHVISSSRGLAGEAADWLAGAGVGGSCGFDWRMQATCRLRDLLSAEQRAAED